MKERLAEAVESATTVEELRAVVRILVNERF
jgi:hypothetical protein